MNGLKKAFGIHCINRNIVECKGPFARASASTWRSINRNIVECKVASRDVVTSFRIVLIETLWNVKLYRLLS